VYKVYVSLDHNICGFMFHWIMIYVFFLNIKPILKLDRTVNAI